MTAEEFYNNLSSAEKATLIDAAKSAMDEVLKSELSKLDELKLEKERAVQKERELWDKQNTLSYGDEKSSIMEERNELKSLINKTEAQLSSQENIVKALSNSGSVIEIQDLKGVNHPRIPDFRNVSSNFITFNEDNILLEKIPPYVPVVDEYIYRANGYKFDSIRLQKDTYIVALTGHNEDKLSRNNYVLLTLDQLVLVNEYYFIKAKAKAKEEAKAQNERAEKHYFSLPEEKRRYYMFQSGIYNSLSTKAKKEISKEDFEKLDLEGREKYYLPIKKYGAKKVVRDIELDTMPKSFHRMYERFIEPDAYTRDSSGNKSEYGKFGDPRVFEYWRKFVEMMNFKIKDIQIQREDISQTYAQAIETSFGESNTDLALKEKFGILIKRQNGDKIKPDEISQIEDAWSSVQSVFGNLKPNSEKYNIKVSHSGNRLIFASKAIGVYIPSMGTIGVSSKYGDNQFKSTLSHEIGHFIDNFIGELSGKRYSTDDFEGTAGLLAFHFRKGMNKPYKEQSDYVNSTKECFARALQQYYGWKTLGDDASIAHSYVELDRTIPIFTADTFVPKSYFMETILPMVELFFSENEAVFKTTFDVDSVDEVKPIEQAVEGDLSSEIEALKELSQFLDGEEKTALLEEIEGLELLLSMQ